MMSSLHKRILSALVLAPLFLAVLILGGWPFLIWLVLAFAASVYEWRGLSLKTGHFWPVMIIGVVYMALSYCSFFALREAYSLNVLLLFLGMIWLSDIGAYFVGKTFGGPKLIVQVSPNKTWSGFGGALFFPALFSGIWVIFMGIHPIFDHHGWYVLVPMSLLLGVVIGCTGQAGDLLVSAVKRQAHVKDTGTLIPGHGGLLDRIDSMLLGAPVFLVLLTLMSYVF